MVDPQGNEWSANLDPDADDATILSSLVEALKLKPGKYGVGIVDSLRLRQDATIKIYEITPSPVTDVKPKKKSTD
ncbi:MAG: hypothetical protein HY326_00865 [Chloroflexi bacterium]|nr:hypothetical protein [Chloroflexota bacterium]